MFQRIRCPGRAFVVGDLRGCLPALRRALHKVDFSPEQGDRLLSAGDLIDRGPRVWPACACWACPGVML